MNSKIWFITGASRGFRSVWAEAARKRGDKFAATARKLTDIADLKECFGDAVHEEGAAAPKGGAQ